MQTPYNQQANKKPTNLSINSDLLLRAKELNINLSSTLEQALAREVKARQAQLWLTENQQSIAAYNQSVEQNGVFSDGLRSF